MTKLIKTINNLRHKAQSLIDGGPFPRNDQKKNFDIILAVNEAVYRIITPLELLERFDKLFSYPGYLRVAKISMYAMVYNVDNFSFQYAFVTNLG